MIEYFSMQKRNFTAKSKDDMTIRRTISKSNFFPKLPKHVKYQALLKSAKTVATPNYENFSKKDTLTTSSFINAFTWLQPRAGIEWEVYSKEKWGNQNPLN